MKRRPPTPARYRLRISQLTTELRRLREPVVEPTTEPRHAACEGCRVEPMTGCAGCPAKEWR